MSRFLFVLLLLPASLFAQLIVSENFGALTSGGPLAGSGNGATGWSDAGWNSGNNAHFQVVTPTPYLDYQVNLGGQIIGSDRAVQLMTNPEPVSGGPVYASRSFAGQNTTLYVSCLIRAVSIGSGSDDLGIAFRSGSTVLARLSLVPDVNQTYLDSGWPLDGASGSISSSSALAKRAFYPGQTNLVVIRITRPQSTQFKVESWMNPPATFPPASADNGGSKNNISVSTLMDNIAFRVASTDTSGPTSSIIADELRMGYTWADVVPQPPAASLVPTVLIEQAVKVRWQTQSGKTYQPQYSFDLTGWLNLGSTIAGDGTIKEVFDATETEAKKFYRVQVQ